MVRFARFKPTNALFVRYEQAQLSSVYLSKIMMYTAFGFVMI